MAEPRIILLDADIVAYAITSARETKVDWGDGDIQQYVPDTPIIDSALDAEVAKHFNKLKADEVIICLSDTINFRHSVLPSYKGNRAATLRPLLLSYAKEYLANNYPSYRKPGLEADDVMGILSTHPKLVTGKKVIVSIDKDMKQIPGWLYNPDKMKKPELVDQVDGDYFHYFQTLTGDTVDGYKGCPSIGKVTAANILQGVAPPWGTHEETWAAIVATYESKGLTEADALVQARCAKILQWQDYDYKNNEVILWNPKTSS